MRIISWIGIVVGLVGCGGSSGGGGSGGGGSGGGHPLPVAHVLVSDSYQEIGAKGYFEGTFTLPMEALVEYDVSDRSTSSPDHWNVGIASSAQLANLEGGRPWSAYAVHNGVSTTSDSTTVSAGSYGLVVQCVNVFEKCQFAYGLTVTY